MNENQMAQLGANKTKMLDAVERMERIVDQYYGHNLVRELAYLRSALETGTEEEFNEAIAETVDGCGTAVSELETLNYILDDFKQAHGAYLQIFEDAINEFEND